MVTDMSSTSPIAEALKALQVRVAERDEYRKFYRGDQGTPLPTPELRRALKGHRGFSLNFCKTITDSLTDRVQVSAITASSDDEDSGTDAQELEDGNEATEAAHEIWERSQLDVTQLAWQYSVLGDAYIGLEIEGGVGDGESASAALKQIDPDMVAPLDDGALFVMTSDTTAMHIALDGTVTRYAMVMGGEWAPVTGDAEDGSIVVAAERVAVGDTPLTIIQRVRNGDSGDRWGTSDLEVAVPQQRAINARAIDIHEVSGNAAWPQNWIVGPGASKAAGKLRSRAGAIQGVEASADGPMTLHQFAAADATKLASTLDSLIEYLSITSGTPLSNTGVGAGASGESRRIAQDKLTRRVMKCLDEIGRAIARLLESALLAERGIEAKVEVSWESPEPVAEKDSLEAAMMKLSLGVSRHTLLAELGYDPEHEAARRADEKAEEQVSMTRAITTGTDTAADITSLLGGAQGDA